MTRLPDPTLVEFIEAELARPAMPAAEAFAVALAARPGTAAVLFYGSCLQRGTTEGVLDFYVLTEGGDWGQSGLAAAAGRLLPPNVYVAEHDGLKAKVAVVGLAEFRARCGLATVDTTFWARFCQRAALLWARDETARREVGAAVASAVETAAVWVDRLAPGTESADAWRALFARTYTVEIRPERRGRGGAIVDADVERFVRLWELTAVAREVAPPAGAGAWKVRWWVGKALHLGRLAKGAFTYRGGARYLLWKIRRHRK